MNLRSGLAAAAFLLLGTMVCAQAQVDVAGSPGSKAVQGAESRVAESRPAEPGTATQGTGAAESRPASRPAFNDVPEGSKDPVVDGMKSLIREMTVTGFTAFDLPVVIERLVLVMEKGSLGNDGTRRMKAPEMARALVEMSPDAMKTMAKIKSAEERNGYIRNAAERLARELYRQLPIFTPSATSGGHSGILRAVSQQTVPEGYVAFSWKTLGGFEYSDGMKLPDEVTRLAGQKGGIAGYMVTISDVENIHEFLLVESLWTCCSGTPPNMNQVVLVTIPAKKGVEYSGSPVQVLGTLEVGPKVEDGFVTSIYRMKATAVKVLE